MNADDSRFDYGVFLRHSAEDQGVVRTVAERLRAEGLEVWFGEWEMSKAGGVKPKGASELQPSAFSLQPFHELSANAFGSDWAQLEAGTLRFRDPLNKERRFIPLRLDDAPIKGSLAQFL